MFEAYISSKTMKKLYNFNRKGELSGGDVNRRVAELKQKYNKNIPKK